MVAAVNQVVDPLDGRNWRVDCGHALVLLPEIPDNTINCSISSPPYFGLRKYHTEPQLWGGNRDCIHSWNTTRYYSEGRNSGSSGLAFSKPGAANAERIKEARWSDETICVECGAWFGELGREAVADCLAWSRGELCDQCYICHLRMVYAEVWRVLRPDGTAWVNLGDSYRKKQLLGIPWRFALALQADGWYLRQEIIWSKPSTMPESVRDRCVKSHEHIFLLAKTERYFFDHKAIQEPAKQTSLDRLNRGVSDHHKLIDGAPGQVPHSISQPRAHKPPRFGGDKHAGYGTRIHSGKEWNPMMAGGAIGIAERKQKAANGEPYVMANKRSVWSISNSGWKGDHFATFPPELVEPMIAAGTKPDAIVLDHFSGMATTGIVALRMGRRYLGIELNPGYAADSRERIVQDAPLFNS